jgi:hypothetical protein
VASQTFFGENVVDHPTQLLLLSLNFVMNVSPVSYAHLTFDIELRTTGNVAMMSMWASKENVQRVVYFC